jgi:DNA-binding winged helix-turn-helix (wHTH) protein/tetratricopeptide (TPR) repeat protein
MSYIWEEFSLDRNGSLLTKAGKQVNVSRKVLDCISHLIEQRHRVVAYDELIRVVWGHENVTNNQLAQIVAAARRAVEDDGQAQHFIRTYSGFGHRWVGEVSEVVAPGEGAREMTASSPSLEASADVPDMRVSQSRRASSLFAFNAGDESPATTGASRRDGKLRLTAILLVVLSLTISLLVLDRSRMRKEADGAGGSGPVETRDELAKLQQSLWRGQYDEVSKRLAALPRDLADTQDAKLLSIELDSRLGRFDQALKKLTAWQAEADAATDTLWRARLLVARSLLKGSMGESGGEVLLPAKSAVLLLESSDVAKSPRLMGEALLARGYGYMKALDYDHAMRDLERSRELLSSAGRTHDAADATDTLARIHMRAGRYFEALELFDEVTGFAEKNEYPVQEIFARNAITKINIELLRWDEALASSERSLSLLRKVPGSERRVRVLLLRARALIGVGRLRDASALIAEAEAIDDGRYSTITSAVRDLATGELDGALAAALKAQAFEGFEAHDTMLLESEEGALLLWLIAAQRKTASGGSVPSPTLEQRTLLQAPTSMIGLIARGRWFWSQGEYGPAEVDLRKAFADARQLGQLSHMLAAAEPLIESLLEHGDIAGSRQALQDLWAYAPDRFAQDYHSNLLKLRVALASGDEASAYVAYRDSHALAGERVLPDGLRDLPGLEKLL